jgi:HPt (histidine-containing phosphotransfer) domain-containing protein
LTPRYDDVPVVDQAVVNELRDSTGGDEAFVLDLVATYIDEASTHLDGMEAAARAGDVSAIVRPAHTLKSSSAALGAMRLSAICRDIEAAAREGRAEGLAEAVEAARAAWKDTLNALSTAGLAT